MLRPTVKVVLLTCLASTLALGADQGPKTLRMASTVSWTVPPFQSHGSAQCDDDANLYFEVAGAPENSTVVMKVAHDGSKYELYTLPSEPGVLANYAGFSITHSGELRVLRVNRYKADKPTNPANPYIGGKTSVFVYLYDSGPNNPSQETLDLPEHLGGLSFAAFESGAVLVTGYFTKHADEQQQGKVYTAVFQPLGKLAAEIPESGKVDFAVVATKLRESAAISGDDGFLYVLQPDSVIVVSESGAIVRKLPFTKPNPDYMADMIYESKGQLVVELYKDEGRGKPFAAQYLVMNASTGERMGLYEPEESLGNDVLCFSRNEGLTFWTKKDGKDVLALAPLR